MSNERRASTPGPGILCMGLSVICWLLFYGEARQSPPREMPLGMLAILPVAAMMHIVAVVTLGFGPRWNRRLAAGALLLFWGGYGLVCAGYKMGWLSA